MELLFFSRSNMRIGFTVNPIAGMGGKAGLKGTDGVLKEAVARGARPVAPQRAIEFLLYLKQRAGNYNMEVLCGPGVMGAEEAKAANFPVQTLTTMTVNKETSVKDTENTVRQFVEANVDLLVFVGGDGTARDILNILGVKADTPVLGVPSGVKMYSGIFAISPADAAEAVVAFIEKRVKIVDAEIMDANEEAIRRDIFDVKLYGYLKGLSAPTFMQGNKEVSPDTTNEKEQQRAIAKYVVRELPQEVTLILGPGTTVECIAEALGIKKTLLGVDVYHKGRVLLDVDENTLLDVIKDWHNTWLILSPIGHQGILLGRGNQQISSQVIRRLEKKHIIVVATMHKLRSIAGGVLRVDTGDSEVDQTLRGNIRVVVDYQMGVQVQIR